MKKRSRRRFLLGNHICNAVLKCPTQAEFSNLSRHLPDFCSIDANWYMFYVTKRKSHRLVKSFAKFKHVRWDEGERFIECQPIKLKSLLLKPARHGHLSRRLESKTHAQQVQKWCACNLGKPKPKTGKPSKTHGQQVLLTTSGSTKRVAGSINVVSQQTRIHPEATTTVASFLMRVYPDVSASARLNARGSSNVFIIAVASCARDSQSTQGRRERW